MSFIERMPLRIVAQRLLREAYDSSKCGKGKEKETSAYLCSAAVSLHWALREKEPLFTAPKEDGNSAEVFNKATNKMMSSFFEEADETIVEKSREN